ncbi:sensor histidine kinase [Sphingosinicella sp. CPCC 101087]|uniref:sensor histidine kinase n=1 Tax=Sphingosinicella sp. CPCC 101087 TaxID=2497754 RepID=UPI00101C3E67|nr:PAS domain-containing protein [Sphingosinicella sp. CPCC 101087]
MNDAAVAEPGEEQPLGEASYRGLFQKIREGFFVAELVRDEAGRAADFIFREVNPAFTEQTGLTASAALGHCVSAAIPGFPASIVRRYGAVVDSGEPAAFEVEVPALDHRSYEARAHPLGDERFAVLFLDITAHKSIERALEESRALLADIVESVDQMIWVTRPDGYHDFFNRRWYEYTGATPGSSDGDGWADLFHPDDQERTFARWRHSLATGDPYEIEYRLRHRSGDYRWMLGRAHPVRDEAGQIIRWMGTCTDIQAQKSFGEQMELASKELSHRIKNIFAVVSGLIALSVRQHPEARAFADEVRDRIAALGRAHDYARPHGDGVPSEAQRASVLGLVRQLLSPYGLEGRERVLVEGDDAPLRNRAATPISLAVHELATNAAKYGALSVPEGQVRVRGERSAERFTLRWLEKGGPPVREPEHFGFGSRLVDITLKGQLGAELVRTWRPEGLEVCLSAPVDQLVAES